LGVYAAAVAVRPPLQAVFPVLAVALVWAFAARQAASSRLHAAHQERIAPNPEPRTPNPPGYAGRFRETVLRFAACSALAGSTALTAAHAGRIPGPRYGADWSPRTIASAVAAINAASGPDDEVLSGGMVWTLESGRRPFLNITHPTAFNDGMSDEVRTRVAERLQAAPPQIIVLDHYTELSYGHVPQFEDALARSYRLLWEHGDAWRPVQIYGLKNSDAAHDPVRP
jgi:hypothetical protein